MPDNPGLVQQFYQWLQRQRGPIQSGIDRIGGGQPQVQNAGGGVPSNIGNTGQPMGADYGRDINLPDESGVDKQALSQLIQQLVQRGMNPQLAYQAALQQLRPKQSPLNQAIIGR
jgi:hypothetical protein